MGNENDPGREQLLLYGVPPVKDGLCAGKSGWVGLVGFLVGLQVGLHKTLPLNNLPPLIFLCTEHSEKQVEHSFAVGSRGER